MLNGKKTLLLTWVAALILLAQSRHADLQFCMFATLLACLPAAATASPPNATSIRQGSSRELPPNPWSFGFQCNERYLDWDTSAQIALIKIWLAEKMEITVPEVRCSNAWQLHVEDQAASSSSTSSSRRPQVPWKTVAAQHACYSPASCIQQAAVTAA
jgi:hypothetical protein